MKLITTIAIIVALIIFGISGRKDKQVADGVTRLDLVGSLPVVIVNDSVRFFNLTDTFEIYYFKDYILYRLPEIRDGNTDNKIPGTEPYFMFRKNDKDGILFKSAAEGGGKMHLPVDSFLRDRAFGGTTFDMRNTHLFINSSRQDQNPIIEKYVPRTVCDETMYDSVYFYFDSELNDVDYTFSKRLDSLTQKKLYMVRLLFNEKFSKTYKVTVPKREVLFKLQKKSVPDPAEILSFVDRFEKPYVSHAKY